MSKKILKKRTSKVFGSIFAVALASVGFLSSTEAQAGIELQSMTIHNFGKLADGDTQMAVKFSFIENDEPHEPLLLDLGDGSEPVDLLTPIPLEPKPYTQSRLGDGLADTVIDIDNTRYKSVFRRIRHLFPAGMESTKIRLVNGAPVRFDILNHDGGNVQYEINIDLKKPESGQRRIRGTDTDIVALTPGKKHSFDLPRVQREFVDNYSCRLVSASKSGLSSVPTIGEEELRITEDCKIQWDTTGAKVGDRYMIQYISSEAGGREWVSIQTIQIVEDIDAVCEVTPGSAYMEAYLDGFAASPPLIPFRIARVPNTGIRSIESGGAATPAFGARVNGRDAQPGWEESFELYNILRQTAGTFMVTFSSMYFDELPLLGPTVCPIVYELGCKDTPEFDQDGDGVCDEVDNCPEDGSSRDQWDRDGDGIGDLCDTDVDGDGLPNNQDACPDSNAEQATNFFGCGVQDLCPCPTEAWEWETKVQCTRRVSFDFALRGIISWDDRNALIEQAEETVCPERKPWSWRDLFWFF